MKEDWKKVKLGNLLTLKYGKSHKGLENGDIPVYGSGGIMRYANKSYMITIYSYPRKGSLNNILFSDKPFWTVDTMFWSIVNSNLTNPRFYITICFKLIFQPECRFCCSKSYRSSY